MQDEELDTPKLIAAILVLNLLFMMLSKKYLPHYASMYLVFACYVVASSERRSLRDIAALIAVSSISLFTVNIWDALGRPRFIWEIQNSTTPYSLALYCLLLFTQITVVSSVLWLLRASLNKIFPRKLAA
jgi:hypothetical protein